MRVVFNANAERSVLHRLLTQLLSECHGPLGERRAGEEREAAISDSGHFSPTLYGGLCTVTWCPRCGAGRFDPLTSAVGGDVTTGRSGQAQSTVVVL